MNSKELKTTLSFWNPSDMNHARELIHPAQDWSKPTNEIMPLLLDGITTGGVALEIGCGVGRLLMPMACRFKEVVGLDIAPNMLALAKQYLGEAGNIQLKLIEDDVFPVEDSTVDYAFSVIVFQHIHYREVIQHYLVETRRILKTGGLVRIQTNKGEPGNREFHGHYYRRLEDFADEFVGAGLVVVNAQEGLWEDEYLWVTAKKVA